jgi:membrane protein DedA with SNARE-associated domain
MHTLVHAVQALVGQFGLIALFILLTIEEAGVWLPLPGEVLVVYSGYRVAHSPRPLVSAAEALAVVVLAVVCGSAVLYSITHRYRYGILRLGRVVRLKERRLQRMERWLQQRGPIVIVLGRLVPGLRIVTTVVAGLFDIPLVVFLPSVALAACLWGLLYLLVGVAGLMLLSPLPELLALVRSAWLLVVVAALVGLGAVVFHRWLSARLGQRRGANRRDRR